MTEQTPRSAAPVNGPGPTRATAGGPTPHPTRATRRRARLATRRRRRTRAATTVLAALGTATCGTVLVLTPGSASRLDVDGGVLQSWTLPGPAQPHIASVGSTASPDSGPLTPTPEPPGEEPFGTAPPEAADEPEQTTAADSPTSAATPGPSTAASPEGGDDPGPDDATGDDSTTTVPTPTGSPTPSPTTSSTDDPGIG